MKRFFTALALATLLAAQRFAQQASDVVPPEAGSGVQAKPVVTPSGRWWSPPIPTPLKPGSPYCATAAARPTR